VQYLAIFWNSGTNRMNKCSERPASTVKLLAIIWVAIHMVAGPLELPAASMTSLFFQRPIDWGAASMPADNQGRVVIVNLPIDMLQPYMFLTNASRRAALPTASWLLSAGVTAVEIESVDAHTVVVRPAAGLFNEPWDRAFRDTSLPFTPGDTLQLNGMTALVTKISPDGRPTEIRYRFEKPLADPQLQWVIWTRRGFRRFKPPEPGERKLLENPSLLWWM
jgi:hypothetical protein